MDRADGVYRYTFAAPISLVAGRTHRVGVSAARAVDGRTVRDDAVLDFRPGGGTPISSAAGPTSRPALPGSISSSSIHRARAPAPPSNRSSPWPRRASSTSLATRPPLARDLTVLAERGYRPLSAQPIDLMRQTAHIEVIATLDRVTAT